jgi:hypothetical protein
MFTSSAIAAQNAAFSAFSSAPSGPTPTPAPVPASHSTLAREVCPICQRRFDEASELVAHYESAHSIPTSARETSNNNSGTTPQVFSGQDCTLS